MKHTFRKLARDATAAYRDERTCCVHRVCNSENVMYVIHSVIFICFGVFICAHSVSNLFAIMIIATQEISLFAGFFNPFRSENEKKKTTFCTVLWVKFSANEYEV